MQDDASNVTMRERALAAGAYLVGGALLVVEPLLSMVWRVPVLSPLSLFYVAAPVVVAIYFAMTRKRSDFVRRHGRLALTVHLAMFLANCFALVGIYSAGSADVGSFYVGLQFLIALPINVFLGVVLVLVVFVTG